MKIVLYSTHCPKCHVLEQKMIAKGINFELIDDMDEVLEFGKTHEILSVPILVVDDKIMDFNEANKYLMEQPNQPKTEDCSACKL